MARIPENAASFALGMLCEVKNTKFPPWERHRLLADGVLAAGAYRSGHFQGVTRSADTVLQKGLFGGTSQEAVAAAMVKGALMVLRGMRDDPNTTSGEACVIQRDIDKLWMLATADGMELPAEATTAAAGAP